MMVVGVPNVGKSTFINDLKQHAYDQGLLTADKVSRLIVGPLPGVTKHVAGFKVTDDPTLVLVDTPGIMTPTITDSLFGYRMALAGLIPLHHVDTFSLVQFSLYVLSQRCNVDQLKIALARQPPGGTSTHTPSQDADSDETPGSLWAVRNPPSQAPRKMDNSELRRLMQCKRIAKIVLQALTRREKRYQSPDDVHSSAASTVITSASSSEVDLLDEDDSKALEAEFKKKYGVSAKETMWDKYDEGEWVECAEEVVLKLSRQEEIYWDEDIIEVQKTQAMELLLRVVREGQLGRFVFEDLMFTNNGSTSGGKKRSGSRRRQKIS